MLTTLTSIQDHLSDLYMLGLLRRYEQNQGLNGGQLPEYELDLDPSNGLSRNALSSGHLYSTHTYFLRRTVKE